MSISIPKKEKKKDKRQSDESASAGNYAYHWSYADYQSSLKEKQNNSGKQKQIASLLLFLSIVLSLVSIAVLFYALNKLETDPQKNATQPQNEVVSTDTDLHDDDYIARSMRRYGDASLQIADDDANITGIGFLMENGYILTDITAFRSAKPWVVDTDGNRVRCTVLFSDLDTHLAVLLPDETLSARGLTVSSVAFTGQSVYLIGFYPEDPSNLAAYLTNINYQDADGHLRIASDKQGEFLPLAIICDLNMQIVGAYTTNDKIETMEQLATLIQAAQQKLVDSEFGFEEYTLVNFAGDTKYETVSYESAALYHVPTGIKLTAVTAGSSAESAGFLVGDIINTVDGKIIKNSSDFDSAISSVTDPFYSVSIYRDGKYYNVKLRA